MAILYDKQGKEYDVPFEVDVKSWLATKRFSRNKPKKATQKGTAPIKATKTKETE